MAVLGRDQVSINEFGRDVDVPNDPIALLMYYLDSICYVLDIQKSEENVTRLRNYRQYRRLSEKDKDDVVTLCFLFSPDELLNKCIFMDDDLCPNAPNKFYNIDVVQDRLIVTRELMIGGKTRKVQKILAFRKFWIEYCFFEPMKQMQPRLQSILRPAIERQVTRAALPPAGRTQTGSSQPRARAALPATGSTQTVTSQWRARAAQPVAGNTQTGSSQPRATSAPQTQPPPTVSAPKTDSKNKNCSIQ